jgi:hypothetical protein
MKLIQDLIRGKFGRPSPSDRDALASIDALPVEHTFKDIRVIGPQMGEAAVSTGSYFPERNVGEIEDIRSCLDIFISVPIAWLSDTTLVLRIYAVSAGVTSKLYDVNVSRLFWNISDNGQRATSAVRARSAMKSAWKITAATKSIDAILMDGVFDVIAWGTCCGDPIISAEDPSLGISPGAQPAFAALMMTWDPTTSTWIPATSGGGPVPGAARVIAATDSVVVNVPSLGAFNVADTDSTILAAAGDRLLLSSQTTPTENGLYVVGTVSAGLAPLIRAPDMATGSSVAGGVVIMMQRSSGQVSQEWMALCSFLSFGAVNTAVIGTTDPQFYPRQCQFFGQLALGTVTWKGPGNGVLLLASGVYVGVDAADSEANALTARYTAPSASRLPGVNGVASIVLRAELVGGAINTADSSFVNGQCNNW